MSFLDNTGLQYFWSKIRGIIGSGTLNTTNKTIIPAINELNSSLTDLIQIKAYSASYTIAANAYMMLSANDFDISTPSGYTAFALVFFTSGNNSVMLRMVTAAAAGTSNAVVLRNFGNSEQTAVAQIRIAYIKSSFVK